MFSIQTIAKTKSIMQELTDRIFKFSCSQCRAIQTFYYLSSTVTNSQSDNTENLLMLKSTKTDPRANELINVHY